MFSNFTFSIIDMSDIKTRFDFKYLSTAHQFHLVDPSPWPLVASIGALCLTSGLVLYMQKMIGGFSLFLNGFCLVLLVMYVWWRDIVREATYEEHHTVTVQRGLRLGMILFIVSEIMFFFAFFGVFFTQVMIYTLVLASLFTYFQGLEYVTAPFDITDGIYGSCFYMATGFHGFHVFVGTIALLISFIRIIMGQQTTTHHFGFESAIWYWHFVDVVWLFLFINIYWWGNLEPNNLSATVLL
uniref:Cytochrome c oxidase subunit 3 n=1 Tax=Pseudo-nitzschia multiseries TaxID=37319 RepID=A0A0G3F1G2_PSEMU|nr:cytochrome c oxidase subunit 3 [Pseudo-nitzschia multiseries]AKJ77325.1 cytochrome c oxidase subunit 3 [Pseudo-nitzschia multiseries]